MEEGVYILKLELENVRCFGEKAMLDLSNGKGNWKRWTVILGNNGTGKTTLLRCITAFEQKLHQQLVTKDDIPEEFLTMKHVLPSNYKYYVPTIVLNKGLYSSLFKNQVEDSIIKAKTTLSTNEPPFDIVAILTSGNAFSKIENINPNYSNLISYGYGANRFMSKNQLTESKSDNSITLFDDTIGIRNAEEWLLQLDYSASKFSEVQVIAEKRRDLIKKILLAILPDIDDIRFTEPTKEKFIPAVEFQTPYGWVTIHQLSLGYKTMVAWIVDLAARMFERYSDKDNPLEQPAIVLVDEIDLHMHPKWQRKIFDYLSDRFPKTQFIVTAHSPLIVQSAPKDANIVLLRRKGDYVVIDNDIESVHNWRIDQILNSDLFGNISQRSIEEQKWMKEREDLILKKDHLTDEEKERLEVLNEKAYSLPTADDPLDIKAMDLIRRAANHLKTQNA